MPTFNDVAPSEWLKWQSFKPGEEKTLTIKSWNPDTFTQQNGTERRTVYFEFAETPSKFGIANKANETSLTALFGAGYDLDSLIGKKITLFVDSWRNAKGEDQSGIRIRVNKSVPAMTKTETDILRDKLQALRAQVRSSGGEPPAMTAAQAATMTIEQLNAAISETMSLIQV